LKISLYHECITKFHRKKFEAWTKKYQAHEQLEVEFEIESATKPNLAPFMSELHDQTSTMTDFKKSWMRFQLATDAYLKLDVALSEHAARNRLFMRDHLID